MKRVLGLGLVLGWAAACSPEAKAPTATGTMRSLGDQLLADQLVLTPEWGRWSGLHQHDGKLADYSRAGIAARIAALEDRKHRLSTSRAQNAEEPLDLALHEWSIDEQLFWLRQRKTWQTDPAFYEELFNLNGYIDRDYLPFPKRFAALVEHEEKALAQVGHIRTNLKLPISRPLAEVAIGIYKGYAAYLRKDVVAAAAKNTDPALEARFEAANGALAAEAEKLAEWLGTVHLLDEYALGAVDFQQLVDIYAGQHISLADFELTGNDALARDQKLYDELAPKVSNPSRPSAAELVPTAQRLTEEARQFIVQKQLVTLPSGERAIVTETPPYKRFNAAWLDTGGPYDPPLGAFFYVTPPDPSWPQERQTEYIPLTGELRATSNHEVYPGHFVQYAFLRRAPTITQRVIGSATFVEGWAHYGEQMMVEEGFAPEPENRLGQVVEALLRDCRYLTALRVHTQDQTLEQAEERFVKDCHQTRAVAKEQSVRAALHPWYFAYTLGKLQILALREEARPAPGYTLRRFHDALLSHGQGPIGLIRPRVLEDLGYREPPPRPPSLKR